MVGSGLAGKLRYGTLGYAKVRSGLVWQFGHGMLRFGSAWRGRQVVLWYVGLS